MKQIDGKDARIRENGELSYHWVKTNIFTRWLPATNQIAVLVFDGPDQHHDQNAFFGYLEDPFWVYISICETVARQQDAAVWSIRDAIREVEKTKGDEDKDDKPNPQFKLLHHVARHATHVTESLDVAARTMDNILLQHERFQKQHELDPNAWQIVHDKLSFLQQLVANLRHRSNSNEKRLANEIQLAFGTVAQYDSSLSVLISRATRADSAAMRTIASLTLIFLPPTFISALFSMSFFNIDDQKGWQMSPKFWIYWVLAVPLTGITYALWTFWQAKNKKEDAERPLMKVNTEMFRK